MTTARSIITDDSQPGAFHLVSRCVRRAFLCGDAAEHRRGWIEAGLRVQAQAFAIDILTFAVMSNHLHIVVRTNPRRVDAWTAREVVERWGLLFPKRDPDSGESVAWDAAEVDYYARNAAWAATRRQRRASVSWFMRILKQRIASRGNADDNVTGHFWEGRFHSVALLTEASVVSCMAYVDLNPIRAKMATTPEASDYTGIQLRLQARQEQRKAASFVTAASSNQSTNPFDLNCARLRAAQGEEHGLWIAPCLLATGGHCSVDDYLELVDQSGRILHSGKRGKIPDRLAPILERLQIDVDTWLSVMLSHGRFMATAVGTVVHLVNEAARRGLKWIVDKTSIHRDRLRPRSVTASSSAKPHVRPQL